MATTEPQPAPPGTRSSTAPSSADGADRAKVQAAKLRLVTDRKLGKVTPEWVRRLADVEPD